MQLGWGSVYVAASPNTVFFFWESRDSELFLKVWRLKLAGRNEDLEPDCFKVQENPLKNQTGYEKFSKFIRVLDCFDIFAEKSIPDSIVIQAANIAAELLDNDKDGKVDNELVKKALIEKQAVFPIFTSKIDCRQGLYDKKGDCNRIRI